MTCWYGVCGAANKEALSKVLSADENATTGLVTLGSSFFLRKLGRAVFQYQGEGDRERRR